jgi:succinoglycan biosynthesis protein ExoL
MTVKIAYFAHDLTDAAVHRRMRMFALGGAAATPIGFRRSRHPVETVAGVQAIDLGPTADGRLVSRAASVARASAKLDRLAEPVGRADAIVARNLEMLFLAVRARKLCAAGAPLVYECLDIHRLLLSRRLRGRLLRALESRLWRDVDLLLTSSPAFTRNYFAPRRFPSPIKLVENKTLQADAAGTAQPVCVRPAPGPPWRIGWFGMIRCRKSLEILSALTRAAGGAVEVIIRGRPSTAAFPDFDKAVADEPYIRFEGPYRNPEDLAAIYGDVHFTWAIDYSDEEENSTWLLPNRIYEGSLYGAVPLALDKVETGRWLISRGAGVVLSDPIGPRLSDFFRRLDRARLAELAAQVEALPRADLVIDRSDCRDLVEAICAADAPCRSGDRRSTPLAAPDSLLREILRRAP